MSGKPHDETTAGNATGKARSKKSDKRSASARGAKGPAKVASRTRAKSSAREARKSESAKDVSATAAPLEAADEAARASAREIFDTLSRWRGEMTTAAEALATACARQVGPQAAPHMQTMLEAQREMLAEMRDGLEEMQSLIARCEEQLADLATSARESPSDDNRRSKSAGNGASGDGRTGNSMAGFALPDPFSFGLGFAGPMGPLSQGGADWWMQAARQGQKAWLNAMSFWMPMALPGLGAGRTGFGRLFDTPDTEAQGDSPAKRSRKSTGGKG